MKIKKYCLIVFLLIAVNIFAENLKDNSQEFNNNEIISEILSMKMPSDFDVMLSDGDFYVSGFFTEKEENGKLVFEHIGPMHRITKFDKNSFIEHKLRFLAPEIIESNKNKPAQIKFSCQVEETRPVDTKHLNREKDGVKITFSDVYKVGYKISNIINMKDINSISLTKKSDGVSTLENGKLIRIYFPMYLMDGKLLSFNIFITKEVNLFTSNLGYPEGYFRY